MVRATRRRDSFLPCCRISTSTHSRRELNSSTIAGVMSVSDLTLDAIRSLALPNAIVATGLSVWLRVDRSSMFP